MENRRQFIINTLSMMTVAAAGLRGLAPVLNQTSTNPIHHLVAGEMVMVQAGMSLFLPPTPQDGDTVILIVRGSSLAQPGVVNFSSAKIAGDLEDLELDSMANVQLTYRASSDDWTLS